MTKREKAESLAKKRGLELRVLEGDDAKEWRSVTALMLSAMIRKRSVEAFEAINAFIETGDPAEAKQHWAKVEGFRRYLQDNPLMKAVAGEACTLVVPEEGVLQFVEADPDLTKLLGGWMASVEGDGPSALVPLTEAEAKAASEAEAAAAAASGETDGLWSVGE